MSTEEFSHSDSYKGYVNSILNSVQERSVSDPVWGCKIPANYEELRQHCLTFIDKYSSTPTISPGQIVASLDPYVSTLNEFNDDFVSKFKDSMISEVRVQKFRELIDFFEHNIDVSLEVAQEQCETIYDNFQQETEPFTAITPEELSKMCLSQAYERSEHHLLIKTISEFINYLPLSKISETCTHFINLFVTNHPLLLQKGDSGVADEYKPPLILTQNEALDAELLRLAENFSIGAKQSQNEILYQVGKLFISSAERSVTWNVLCVNDQISDPAASSVQFKLFAARAHTNMDASTPLDYIPSHRQIHFVSSYLDSFGGKVDEILCGEESFLHVASAQVIHQRITEITRGATSHLDGPNATPAQKQSGIIKMKFLRTQMLRQTIISTVNWMVSLLKRVELDLRDTQSPNCMSNASILFERDVVVESKQFPHCIVVRNPSTSHNVIYEETLDMMERIRNDLLNFGSFYIRKWEKECGSQIDRKSIVEDLYECESKYQASKKKLLDALFDLYNRTYSADQCKKLCDLIRFTVLSRPVLALDIYDYVSIPFDFNSLILDLQAEVVASQHIKSVDDLIMIFNAVRKAVSVASLKQDTLNIDANVNLEFIMWTYVRDFLKEIDTSTPSLTELFEDIQLSSRVKALLEAGAPQSPDQIPYYANLQSVRFETIRSIILYRTYLAQCDEDEETQHHLPKTLFSELNEEDVESPSGFILAVDEVKEGGVEISGDGLETINRLQQVDSALLDAITNFNFTITELKSRLSMLSDFTFVEAVPKCYTHYFNTAAAQSAIEFLNAREYPSFQSVLKMKANIRESIQVLNLNAGSHLEELIAAQQKQTLTVVQFLQNRGRLPDVLRYLQIFNNGTDKVPNVLEGFSNIESVQPSMRREKVRAILEFYSLALLYGFLSYHATAISKTLVKIHKHQRKLRFDAPHLTELIEETSSLQNEAQRSQAAKMRATDLLLRINVACIEAGLIFGRSHHPHSPDTAPAILDLSGDWTISSEEIKERPPMNIMQTIESELEQLRNLNISLDNIHFLFLWQFDNEQRQAIKVQFDSLQSDNQLVDRFRQLRQKTLLIRLMSSPSFSCGEICSFPSPFNHYLIIIDNILKENNEGLRFVLLHILIQRCIKRPKSIEPPQLETPPLVTEKSPFLADVDALPQETKSDTLHPALAQFIENLQLHSKSDTRSEIKISQFHVNQALLKFSQSIAQLFDSSLVESHKAFLGLHTMLYDSNHKHEDLFRKRVQAINREARTFNRKLQTALADRSHTVGYEINLLQETLKSSKFDKNERQKAIRRRLREEYSPQVREMTLQLFSLKHNLEQYQKNLQHEIEGNMFEIKKQSISQLLRSQNLPEEVKDSMKQAFDFDDALHELMETKSELSSTVFKLRAMRLLQDFAVRSDFQVRLKKIEEQREMVKQENNEFTKERDVKEAALKQQYTTVMQSVRSAEKEVEKLRRELELENKNRNKLREWRQKHEKRVSVLEKKLKRLTEWSKYKPDKLIFELDQIEKEIERRKRAKERGPALLEKTKTAVNKELKRCQYQLQVHEQMKADIEKESSASLAKQNLTFSNEMQNADLVAVMNENERLKEENEQLQQRLAELSLQIAAVSQITIGGRKNEAGLKVKASRLDGLC
ncbi:hypothetical protein TRFO_13881 [Tritrichomonas foetus]|uniref:Uncharacterized protein n=1 Tax=Tritrichomonas foetus TaxID=1144522 RepID=A0A1J4L1F5_9EUKA|nr:hypothetical protein TRFO_13881 [Tritrichomonas foetus]|eukprot:OHT15717.1 hypothetical protein TRFO_13881 [Tritrichomonas foetus]